VVDHVQLEPTFDERLRLFRESLASTYSPSIHFELCRWLVDERQYTLAEEELSQLVAKSKLPEAVELLRVVQAQLALQAPRPPRRNDRDDDSPDEPDDDRPRSGSVLEADLLPDTIISAADVNVMRVYEIDFANPPKVAVDPDTIRALLEAYGTSPLIPASTEERTALFRADPLQIVRLMFELRAREFYPRIQVLSEPHSLNEFRRRVHNTWLINNCATSGCHGGARAGRFFLHRRDHKDDRVRYTNLLILERLSLNEQWPLINYDDPMMSVIIQHGLPRSQARLPHPPAKGWKPVFAGSSPRLLQGTLQWIDSMFRPRPDYPVEFEPPVMGGSGPPAAFPEQEPGESPADPAPGSDPVPR
jgi:hypothetical protein